MAFCRLVLVLSVICYCQATTVNRVPVFLWGDLATTSIKGRPLETVSSEEFNSVLKQELNSETFTVCFIEETLSVEDFSLKRDDGFSAYPYLVSNVLKSVYLPTVESPLRALNSLADPDKVDHVKWTENGLSVEIERASNNYLFINLKDAKEGESRFNLLRRHDEFMSDMVSKLKEKHGQVVAIYTAHYPSWTMSEEEIHSRVRRQAKLGARDTFAFDNLLMYVGDIEMQDGDKITSLSGLSGHTSSSNDTYQQTTLTFGSTNITLFFSRMAGYWSFDEVDLELNGEEHTLRLSEPLYVLDDFSYRCAQSLVFSTNNPNVTTLALTFHNIKVQPFSGNATEFSDSLNCVGFFSAPIWAALFIVFICLAITFSGLMMMTDINTMDRFDDPKGKTITISAAE